MQRFPRAATWPCCPCRPRLVGVVDSQHVAVTGVRLTGGQGMQGRSNASPARPPCLPLLCCYRPRHGRQAAAIWVTPLAAVPTPLRASCRPGLLVPARAAQQPRAH
jgi:hypothetical protein